MQLNKFFIEVKQELTHSDFFNLRMLYTPVLGSKPIAFFQYLYDLFYMDGSSRDFHTVFEVKSQFKTNITEIKKWSMKLEAVGLIRTFEKADNETYIFRVNKPLDAIQFQKNSLLKSDLVSRIGELQLEKIILSSKSTSLDKSEYTEITTKYQDMFSIYDKKYVSSQNTLEIALPSNLSIDEALISLPSTQFIYFLSSAKASPSQIAEINQLRNLGLSSASINEVIRYSWDKNGKVVMRFIDKIAKDLISKDIKSHKEINKELQSARSFKSSAIIKDAPKSAASVETINEDWDDLFNKIGGSF